MLEGEGDVVVALEYVEEDVVELVEAAGLVDVAEFVHAAGLAHVAVLVDVVALVGAAELVAGVATYKDCYFLHIIQWSSVVHIYATYNCYVNNL